ncbi:Ig-like domain-containing protein [Actinoplanes sp. NPDC023714]|uniref:Ig-like domain-containing protein n=1 Tax=Actinoplanes sp. NPDC023714 TaxID=3154322 RepID=UPI0033F6BC73
MRTRALAAGILLTTLAVAPAGAAATATAAAAAAATTPVASIDFRPAGTAAPTGWTADTGAAWTAARGFGWIRQDTATESTPTPLDLAANTRNRARAGVDPLDNTLIHLQYGDVGGTNGVLTAGAWQYAVPPGTYTVTATAGDQPSYDSVHVIRAEGRTAIDHFTPAASREFLTGSVTVPVTDGMLTVDAVGGRNTKLTRLTIGRVVDDTTAPPAPTGLAAAPGDRQVALTWTAGTAADLLGYRVYRDGTLISGAGLVTAPAYTDTTAANGTARTYTVSAVDASGNESARSQPRTATPVAFTAKVAFSDQASTPPAGYLKDYGQAFGTLGYGWIDLEDGGPLNLVGNGRDRGATTASDVRLTRLMHAQAGGKPAGAWEIAVPNGLYTVTAAVGDSGTATDSVHYLNVEDQNAVAAFRPAASAKHVTATRTVSVTDGRLTLSPKAGTNTKFHYVDVASVPAAGAIPAVRAISPANLSTGLATTTSIVADLVLPSGAVDPESLGGAAVRLTRVADGATVPTNAITSGGGDVVNASPLTPLAAGTLYRLDITAAVTDVEGHAFAPYSMVFTTGAASGGGPAFTKVTSGGVAADYTSVTMGPDGRLYAATLNGRIYRYPVAADGTLGTPATIDTVQNRTIIGLAFDPASTAANPILWITSNHPFTGTYDVPDFSSVLARLTGPDLGTYTPVLTGLPRSVKDHETNSVAFGPDGALYISQGANNAMGAPDAAWRDRPERLLTAAILRLDPAKLPASLPLDVKTEDGGTYDPYAPGAPLTLYGTGVRNAYDLVWHRNGHLYVPTNGSAAGGNTPDVPSPLPASCSRRVDGGYTGPVVAGLRPNPQAETDYVFDVKPGRYYGHPNPSRCEWILAGGNPTGGADPFQVNGYPAGTAPDPNLDLAGIHDAGLHASANGAVEYRGGALDGKLLVVRYSDGQDIQMFDVAPGGALTNRRTVVAGFNQPLDVTQSRTTGDLYVTELGARRITLLRPS